MRIPPSTGPLTAASPTIEEKMPKAAPIRSRGNTSWMIAMGCGASAAAPKPCSDPGRDQLRRVLRRPA